MTTPPSSPGRWARRTLAIVLLAIWGVGLATGGTSAIPTPALVGGGLLLVAFGVSVSVLQWRSPFLAARRHVGAACYSCRLTSPDRIVRGTILPRRVPRGTQRCVLAIAPDRTVLIWIDHSRIKPQTHEVDLAGTDVDRCELVVEKPDHSGDEVEVRLHIEDVIATLSVRRILAPTNRQARRKLLSDAGAQLSGS